MRRRVSAARDRPRARRGARNPARRHAHRAQLRFFPEQYFRGETPAKELERNVSRLRRRLLGQPPKGGYWANNLLMALAGRGKEFGAYFKTGLFLQSEGFSPAAQVEFFDHHRSHAVLAAFYSGYDSAAVVTMDGVGDLAIHHTSSTFRDGALQRVEVNDAKGASAGNFYCT